MKHLTLVALAAAALLLTALACTDKTTQPPSTTGPSQSTSTPGASTGSSGGSGPSATPVASGTPTAPPTVTSTATPTPPGSNRRIVEAPIEQMAIRVAESAPPQYFLDVTSGLPSGCAQFYRVDVSRAGTTVTVKVLNTIPTAAQACTTIYGFKEHHLALGSDFASGTTYTVNVNDKATTFKAQ